MSQDDKIEYLRRRLSEEFALESIYIVAQHKLGATDYQGYLADQELHSRAATIAKFIYTTVRQYYREEKLNELISIDYLSIINKYPEIHEERMKRFNKCIDGLSSDIAKEIKEYMQEGEP